MKTFALFLLLLTHTAHAAESKLSGAGISLLLRDVQLTASDEGRHISQIFQKSGVTLYIVDGQQSQGFWRVDGDQYCSQWPPHEQWDCFALVQNGKMIAFISARGKRYEMLLPDTQK